MLNISKFPFVSYPFKQIHTLNTEKEVKQRESKRVKIHNFNLDWTRNVVSTLHNRSHLSHFSLPRNETRRQTRDYDRVETLATLASLL